MGKKSSDESNEELDTTVEELIDIFDSIEVEI